MLALFFAFGVSCHLHSVFVADRSPLESFILVSLFGSCSVYYCHYFVVVVYLTVLFGS